MDIKPRVPPERLTQGVSVGSALEQGISEFAAAVVRARPVEPLLREIVRLRCAQFHDCRLCGSLRLTEALDQGFDEQMQAKIARYESSDFGDDVKAALRLCDAMIMTPGSVPASLRAELQAHFTDQQIAGLCLDIIKWGQQKALVAMRLEAPLSDITTTMSFDDHGDPVFGGPAYA